MCKCKQIILYNFLKIKIIFSPHVLNDVSVIISDYNCKIDTSTVDILHGKFF